MNINIFVITYYLIQFVYILHFFESLKTKSTQMHTPKGNLGVSFNDSLLNFGLCSMETVQQNGRFTLFSSNFLSIYSILYVSVPCAVLSNLKLCLKWIHFFGKFNIGIFSNFINLKYRKGRCKNLNFVHSALDSLSWIYWIIIIQIFFHEIINSSLIGFGTFHVLQKRIIKVIINIYFFELVLSQFTKKYILYFNPFNNYLSISKDIFVFYLKIYQVPLQFFNFL